MLKKSVPIQSIERTLPKKFLSIWPSLLYVILRYHIRLSPVAKNRQVLFWRKWEGAWVKKLVNGQRNLHANAHTFNCKPSGHLFRAFAILFGTRLDAHMLKWVERQDDIQHDSMTWFYYCRLYSRSTIQQKTLLRMVCVLCLEQSLEAVWDVFEGEVLHQGLGLIAVKVNIQVALLSSNF